VEDADPEAVRLAEVFRRSPLGQRAERATRAEREFNFFMAVEELVIHGTIDLWFEERGEIVIVDYKTDAVSGQEAHRKAEDYAIQLRLYAMALERFAGRPVHRAYLHFLRPNTMVEVDLTPSLLDSPEQVVREFQEAQERLEFDLKESEQCRRCRFYRDLCPAV
jgi:ATP-dependent helicase/nuclease subunit A